MTNSTQQTKKRWQKWRGKFPLFLFLFFFFFPKEKKSIRSRSVAVYSYRSCHNEETLWRLFHQWKTAATSWLTPVKLGTDFSGAEAFVLLFFSSWLNSPLLFFIFSESLRKSSCRLFLLWLPLLGFVLLDTVIWKSPNKTGKKSFAPSNDVLQTLVQSIYSN